MPCEPGYFVGVAAWDGHIGKVLRALVSVTRLDNLWKFLATNFLIKVAKIFGDFWGFFEKSLLKAKIVWLLFGQLFITKYGHTGDEQNVQEWPTVLHFWPYVCNCRNLGTRIESLNGLALCVLQNDW